MQRSFQPGAGSVKGADGNGLLPRKLKRILIPVFVESDPESGDIFPSHALSTPAEGRNALTPRGARF
jgi:hypothetical protein